VLDLFDEVVDLGLVHRSDDHRGSLPRVIDASAGEQLIEHATRLECPIVELVRELLFFLCSDRFGRQRFFGDETYATLDALDNSGVVLGPTLETPHGSHRLQSRISKRERALVRPARRSSVRRRVVRFMVEREQFANLRK